MLLKLAKYNTACDEVYLVRISFIFLNDKVSQVLEEKIIYCILWQMKSHHSLIYIYKVYFENK